MNYTFTIDENKVTILYLLVSTSKNILNQTSLFPLIVMSKPIMKMVYTQKYQ